MKLVSDSTVELLDVMGNDLSVVNAARVSFDKQSDWDYEWAETEVDVEGRVLTDYQKRAGLKSKDKKLIKYLYDHNHWSPFAHAFLKFRITAPISVARQLGKHQVGLAWNEVSRRYVSYTPEIYNPTVWRAKATDKKQGSSSTEVYLEPDSVTLMTIYEMNVQSSVYTYEQLLKAGVCEEQARLVLPQGAMTTFIWSGSLFAFLRVCRLRTAPDAQKETRDVATKIEEALRVHFPVSAETCLNTKP